MEEARSCLILDLKCLNVQEGESSSLGELDSGIPGEEAHLGLYREVRNVTVGLYIHCSTVSFTH